MKSTILVLALTLLSCSGPERRGTLRTDSGGQNSVVKDPQHDSEADASSNTGPTNPAGSTTEETTTPVKTPSVIDNNPAYSCSRSVAIGKRKICETTVEGIRVKFIPIADGAPVSRLAFYLHGDTAADWKNRSNKPS